MTEILCKVASMIGATVLEASRQDYDPQAMLLMAWFAWAEWVRRA
jgi:S-adenosylmethionine/arginine decarboxylase-like enzyme